MKRKTEERIVPDHIYTDVKRDLTPEQLAAVGAITLSWNGIEGAIDGLMAIEASLPVHLANEVISRINGFDGKVAIIRKAIAANRLVTSELKAEIGLALDAAAECKVLRDAIAHAHLANQELGYGSAKRGAQYSVVMSQAALDGLYERMTITTSELVAAVWLIASFKVVEKTDSDEGKTAALSMSLICVTQFRNFQKTRRNLPPLPACPEIPPAQLELGDVLYQSIHRLAGATKPPPMTDSMKETVQQVNELGRAAIQKRLPQAQPMLEAAKGQKIPPV